MHFLRRKSQPPTASAPEVAGLIEELSLLLTIASDNRYANQLVGLRVRNNVERYAAIRTALEANDAGIGEGVG